MLMMIPVLTIRSISFQFQLAGRAYNAAFYTPQTKMPRSDRKVSGFIYPKISFNVLFLSSSTISQ